MPQDWKPKETPSNAGLLALLDQRPGAAALAAAPGSGFIAATDGLAVEFAPDLSAEGEAVAREKITRFLGPDWELRDDSLTIGAATHFRGLTALPPPGRTPPVGEAWDLARKLAGVKNVRSVTPLFAQLAPTPVREEAEPALLAASAAELDRRRNWHLAALQVPAAWDLLQQKGLEPGQDVLVAVVDTGYTRHPEILARLARLDGTDVIRGIDLLDDGDPRDPLEGGSPYPTPSHGTSVTSVIASPAGPQAAFAEDDFVTGVAPGSQVLPVRMTGSVALLLPNKLIRAIYEAVAGGADVINMCLGLPYSWPALHAAIRHALANGVIVVAASGNYWPRVQPFPFW